MKIDNHNRVIHNNAIFITQELGNYNASGHIWGISANDCDGVSIGDNLVVCDYGSGVPIPGTVDPPSIVIPQNTDKTVGIWIDNCQDAMVGCNETHYFGQGIHLEDDVTGTTNPNAPHNYSNNTMASCYNGLFLEVGLIADHFGSGGTGLGVDNSWPMSALPGPAVTFNARVLDNRSPFSTPAPTPINYYYSIGTFDPQLNNPLFSKQANSSPNSCMISSPPSNKRSETSKNGANEIIVYPNPSEHTIFIKGERESDNIAIYSITNVLGLDVTMKTHFLNDNELDISELPLGTYILNLHYNGFFKRVRIVKK